MPLYRYYPIKNGRGVGVQVFAAPDDEAALERARIIAKSKPFELWLGARKVGHSGETP